MVERPLFSSRERRVLESLLQHDVRFMVVGLSAAMLQGAHVVTQDIDLWFEDLSDPRLSEAMRKIGAAYVPPINLNPPMLVGAGAELFDLVTSMSGLGKFSDELRHTRELKLGKHRLKVLSLERILVSKTAANRPKDRMAIPVLKNVLRALQTKQARRKKLKAQSSKKGPSPKLQSQNRACVSWSLAFEVWNFF